MQAHWELVEYLAGKFAKDSQLREDLIQVGGIGLTKALQRFDSKHGVQFVTYATPTIVGEIKRYLRDSTWSVKIGRQAKTLYYQIEEARAYLTSKLGRTPTLRDISEWLNVDEEKLIEASEAGPNRVSASFQQETSGDDMVLEDFLGNSDEEYDAVENRILLRDSMATLAERSGRFSIFAMLKVYRRAWSVRCWVSPRCMSLAWKGSLLQISELLWLYDRWF